MHTRYYHYQLAPPENQVANKLVYPSPVLSNTYRPSKSTGISRYKMLSLDPPLPSSPGYQHYENQHHKNHYRVYQSFIFYLPGLHQNLHDLGHKSITYTTINPMKITNTVHTAIFIHRSIKATLLTIRPPFYFWLPGISERFDLLQFPIYPLPPLPSANIPHCIKHRLQSSRVPNRILFNINRLHCFPVHRILWLQ